MASVPLHDITAVRFTYRGGYLYPITDMDAADQVVVVRSPTAIRRIRDTFLRCDRKPGETEDNQLGKFSEVTDRVDFVTKNGFDACDFCVMNREVDDLYGREVGELYRKYRRVALHRKKRRY